MTASEFVGILGLEVGWLGEHGRMWGGGVFADSGANFAYRVAHIRSSRVIARGFGRNPDMRQLGGPKGTREKHAQSSELIIEPAFQL